MDHFESAHSTYKTVSSSEISKIKNMVSCLIITATTIETEELHKKLLPFNNTNAILKISEGTQTYYVGKFGEYGIAHVQCDNMGSSLPGGSINTIGESVNYWEPKAIVMVGIAFGVDRKTQSIGDVLISEAIIPYDIKRESKNEIMHRGLIPPAGRILLNRIKNLIKNWNHTLPNKAQARVIPCHLLSGESLIDNQNFRDQLLRQHPHAKGGEMEGWGVFSAAENKNIEWVLIKSICDFADGNKSKGKKANQKIAAESAVAFCLSLFSEKNAFKELNIHPLENNKIDLNVQHSIVSAVLFNTYELQYENYYLKRQIDLEVESILSYFSIWLSGESGVGKTNLLLRYLLINKKKYKIIDLSCCSNSSVDNIFKQIYLDLKVHFQREIIEEDNKLFESSIYIRKIVGFLKQVISKDEDIIILIEEIPIETPEQYSSFIEKIAALIIYSFNSFSNANIKFILSTINNPVPNLKDYQKKVKEKLKFKNYEVWPKEDLEHLLNLISKEINIKFSNNELNSIVLASNGSPRFIKTFLKNYLSTLKVSGITFDRVLADTISDLRN